MMNVAYLKYKDKIIDPKKNLKAKLIMQFHFSILDHFVSKYNINSDRFL